MQSNVVYYEVYHTSPLTFARWKISASLFWWIVNNQHDCAYSSRRTNSGREYVVLFTKDSNVEKVSDLFELQDRGVIKWRTIDLGHASINRKTTAISTGISIGESLAKNASDNGLNSDLPSQPSLF